MENFKEVIRKELKGYTLSGFLPLIGWIGRYNRQWAISDIIAGCTVGMVIVPFSLAYAVLANIPLENGLYSCFFPQVIYPIIATSKDASMGLTAVLSTLCGQLVTQYAAEAGMSNIQFMTSVAMVTGFLELILVITRVTIIIDLISAPIIFGFSTGAGIAIMCGQLPTLMGIKGINGKQPAFRILGDTIRSFDRTGIDFTVGAISLLILWGWTKMARVLGAKGFTWAPYLGHASNAIVLIIMPIVGYLANQGKVVPVFKTVGNVPTGLGRMHIPDVFKNFSPVLSASLTVVLVNCIEHIAVTKLFARKKGYKISPRNEIMNIGIMNIWGSLNGGIPVGASLSRSPVKASSGTASPLADFVTAIILLLIIYFVSPVFKFMPSSTLSAIIVFSVLHLLTDPRIVWKYWVYQKTDFLAWFIAMITTPLSSIQYGIFASVGFGVAVLLYRIARPHISTLTRVAGLWKEAKSNIELNETGIAIIRIEESLIYPNASFIADEVKDMICEATKSQEDPNRTRLWNEPTLGEIHAAEFKNKISNSNSSLRGVIIDFSSVNSVDSTGLQCLQDIQADAFRHAGTTIPILFVNVKERLVSAVHTFHTSIPPLVVGSNALEENGDPATLMNTYSNDERNGCNLVFDSIDEAIIYIPIAW